MLFFKSCPPCFLRQGLRMGAGACWLSRLTGRDSQASACLCLRHAVIITIHHHARLFMQMLRLKPGSPWLCSRHFINLAFSPAPVDSIFLNIFLSFHDVHAQLAASEERGCAASPGEPQLEAVSRLYLLLLDSVFIKVPILWLT